MVWGELQLTDLGPHCWPHPSAEGLGQVAGRRAEIGPALWGGHPTTRKVSSGLRKVSKGLRKVSSRLRKVSSGLKEDHQRTEEGSQRTEEG